MYSWIVFTYNGKTLSSSWRNNKYNLKFQNCYLFNYIYYVLWLELTGAAVGGNKPNIRFDFGDKTSIIISILKDMDHGKKLPIRM